MVLSRPHHFLTCCDSRTRLFALLDRCGACVCKGGRGDRKHLLVLESQHQTNTCTRNQSLHCLLFTLWELLRGCLSTTASFFCLFSLKITIFFPQIIQSLSIFDKFSEKSAFLFSKNIEVQVKYNLNSTCNSGNHP